MAPSPMGKGRRRCGECVTQLKRSAVGAPQEGRRGELFPPCTTQRQRCCRRDVWEAGEPCSGHFPAAPPPWREGCIRAPPLPPLWDMHPAALLVHRHTAPLQSSVVLCCLLLFPPFCLRRLRGDGFEDLPGRCVLCACAQRPSLLPVGDWPL